MLYKTPLILIYLKPGSLYLLTAFIQFSLTPPSSSGYRKSDLFFCVCDFVFEVQLTHDTVLVPITQHSCILI